MEGLKPILTIIKLSGQSQDKIAKLEKIPDPAVFDGAKKKLNNFIINIYIKLNMNADRYISKK
jgi:predicted XRE-type DNA-binding protein